MKHIFWIHSSTAYYTSLAIIKEKRLNYSDIILLLDRNYKNKYDFDYKFTEYDVLKFSKMLSPFKLQTLFKIKYITGKLDEFLLNICRGVDFFVYIPQLSHPVFQIIITNEKCKGYSFVEEGVANYKFFLLNNPPIVFPFFKKNAIRFVNLFLSRVNLNNSFFGLLKKVDFVPSYFLLDNCLNELRSNIFNKSIFIKWEIHPISFQFNQNIPVIILSPLVEYELINKSNFILGISIIIDVINSNDVYIKFHPFQSDEIINDVINIVKMKGKNDLIIPNDEPFEQIILQYPQLKIYGFESSLLFYAKILSGHSEVFSVSNFIEKVDSTYHEYVKLNTLEFVKYNQIC
jgi:hypothetical protein